MLRIIIVIDFRECFPTPQLGLQYLQDDLVKIDLWINDVIPFKVLGFIHYAPKSR